MKKVAVISFKFHPGHYSHLIAFYSLLKELYFSPVLYVNKKFDSLDTLNIFKKIHFLQFNQYHEYDVAFFLFPSLRNVLEILKFRAFSSVKIIYVFHEPINSYYDFYKSGFGFFQIFKLFIIDLINIFVILFSDKIILSSNTAFSVYYKKNIYPTLELLLLIMPLLTFAIL